MTEQELSKEEEPSKEQESSEEKAPSTEQETSRDPEPSKSFEEIRPNSETADAKATDEAKPKGWSAYIPSLGLGSGKSISEPPPSSEKASGEEASGEKAAGEKASSAEASAEKASKGWSSYFPSGQGFTSYLPSKGLISAFAASHYRDPNKPYAEQLADFARTPVGAAGLSGIVHSYIEHVVPCSQNVIVVATGSGPAGTLYAAYAAYDAQEKTSVAPMEYMSMPHTRARTQRLVPKPNDTLVSNLREPLLTLIEDTSPGIHDTLIAACDPQRYKGLGVEKWEEHGSCSENLVLALKELNEKAGLKGAQAVGADIIVEKVPAPLNLFMNIPWNREGKLRYEGPAGDEGDSVTFRAERDVIVVMSACPQDVLAINGGKPTDAHFIVQEPESKVSEEEEQSKAPKDSVEEGEEKHS